MLTSSAPSLSHCCHKNQDRTLKFYSASLSCVEAELITPGHLHNNKLMLVISCCHVRVKGVASGGFRDCDMFPASSYTPEAPCEVGPATSCYTLLD